MLSKMKELVEATGECWHNTDFTHPPPNRIWCEKCGILMADTHDGMLVFLADNDVPSKESVDDLLDIADRLQMIAYVGTDPLTGCTAQARNLDGLMLEKFNADTCAMALLNALHAALKKQ